MAWIQKRGGVYWMGWRHDGKEFRKSLKTRKKDVAEAELAKINSVEMTNRANAVTGDYIAAITGKAIPKKVTAAGFMETWLKESDTSHGTELKYKQVVKEFQLHLGVDATLLGLDEITTDHVHGFLAQKRLKSAPGTVAGFKRILSSIFLNARERGLITGNPVALVKLKRKTHEETNEKRPFTLAEVRDLHARANAFWKYMIRAGFFTGQSLGDLVTLKRSNVDLSENVIRLTRRKTKKRVIIPIAKPLREMFVEKWPKKDGDYFWPDEAERYLKSGASSFSQEFYDLMTAAGMVAARDEKKKGTGKGRGVKREKTIIGYHNLRHTFVTNLKIGGAVDSVAKELAGHSSAAINTQYTHLPIATLANAVNQLPEVGL